MTSYEFLESQADYSPFIIRTGPNLYSGEAILWPAPSENGKEFIECKDDTPLRWQGYSYERYIKQNARTFIKMTINGSITMVIKPKWYDSDIVPGTKFFKLVNTNNPVFKFLSTVLSNSDRANSVHFNAVNSDHCNQTSRLGVYELVPIEIEELKDNIIEDNRERDRLAREAVEKAKNKKLRKSDSKNKRFSKKEAIEEEPNVIASIRKISNAESKMRIRNTELEELIGGKKRKMTKKKRKNKRKMTKKEK
jgi:hypothetical protein